MYDKFIEIFYYFVPGGSFISILLYHYWDSLDQFSFFQYIKNNQWVFIIFFILFSFIAGLLIEGTSKIIIKWLITDRIIKPKDLDKKYKINRYLFYYQKRNLPEYFSSRSAFFRHFVIVLLFAGVVFKIYCWFVLAALASFGLHLFYTDKDNKTLEGYFNDLNSHFKY